MLTNEKFKAEMIREIRENRKLAKQRVDEIREVLATLEPIADQLDQAGIAWHVGYKSLNIWPSEKTKSAFAVMVERLSKIFNEPPTVNISTDFYRATFLSEKVNVWVHHAEDCKVIEVEETITRKVLKPHPACVAALSKLEDIA